MKRKYKDFSEILKEQKRLAEIGECPYCNSDNKAVRETYFNPMCTGCDKRKSESKSEITQSP